MKISGCFYRNSWVIVAFLLGCQPNIETQEPTTEISKTAPLFKSIPSSQSNITFTNTIQEKYDNFFESFQYVYNGAGVASGDFNNDGLTDIYFTANETSNKLYLNKGNFTFEDITESAKVGGDANWTNGVALVDINADGWLDIYVSRGGWQDTPEQRKNLLFINQGDLTFEEEAEKYGIADTGYSIQATFFDADNDLDLDMYLINRPEGFRLSVQDYLDGAKNTPKDQRDKLYINEGGVFKEEGEKRGITNNFAHGLSVVTADINQDGFTDIFVANDFEVNDYLYINQKDGTFKEQIKETTNHISFSSMGADIADINNDGLEDMVVMEMQASNYIRSKVSMPQMNVPKFGEMVDNGMHKQFMHNMLHLNQGNNFFSEIGQYAGIAKTDWSWSVLNADFDNNGYKDLLVTNGLRRDFTDRDADQRVRKHVPNMKERYASPQEAMTKGIHEIVGLFNPVKIPNYLFRNGGNYQYEDVSSDWGFNRDSFSNGAAIADFDNDGDLDVVINNIENEAFLYENTTNASANFLKVQLEGTSQNPVGLNAKVWLHYEGELQYFENKTVRGYLSTCEPTVHFGLGKIENIDSLKVEWSDGKVTSLTNIKSNQTIKVSYKEATESRGMQSKPNPLFTEVTEELFSFPFQHNENKFDEYEEQVLLPHEFAKSGPFVAVTDVNGDGEDDFYVGGASNQSGILYLQNNGKFLPKNISLFQQDKAFEDMQADFADLDGDGDKDLIVTSGGSQFETGSENYRARVYYNNGQGNFTKRDFLPIENSASALAIHDVDKDGDLDIFIGGQVIANRYLVAPKSYLFINEGGKFENKIEELAPELQNIGMIHDAKWADVTGNGNKELVLAGEWMPITIFSEVNGKWENITNNLELTKTVGWYYTIESGDFDKDGDEDLVLGALGENYKFKASEEKPFEVFAGDFDGNGTHDVFLAKHYQDRLVPIRGKDCTSQQMPVIGQKFNTFNAFAKADVQEIIGQNLEQGIHTEAYQFASLLLENVGNGFELRKLPTEAQFSSIMAIEKGDFNQDGYLDLLIAGNRFDVEIETTPADASPSYLLLGDGKLNFEAVAPKASGLFLPHNIKDLQTVGGRYVLATENDGLLRGILWNGKEL